MESVHLAAASEGILGWHGQPSEIRRGGGGALLKFFENLDPKSGHFIDSRGTRSK